MSIFYLKFIKETLQVIDCNIGIVKYTIKMGKILSYNFELIQVEVLRKEELDY